MKKIIKRMFLIFLFLFLVLSLNEKTFAGTISNDIQAIDENLYPGVKSKIEELQKQYPNWIFKIEYTDLEWEEVLNGEYQGHGQGNSPKNLSPANNPKYSGLWICEICGKNVYDNGTWHCASKEALAYMMDVRNSLNKTDVFQFLELSSQEDLTNNEALKAKLKEMAKTATYLDDECIDAIISAATKEKVNPYYLVAKIIQEQGMNETPLISGKGYNGEYEGVYNFFNIGASGNSKDQVIKNGLSYAMSQNWTTKVASIENGARMIAKNYIAKGQDTLYYQKYNVVGDNLFSHQYQQNILGAQNEGSRIRKNYLQIDPELTGNYTFTIPVYKNMPKEASPRPNTIEEHKPKTNVMMGDVNQDGCVDIMDVVTLINYLNGEVEVTPKGLMAAKVTGEETESIMDVVTIINYLNGEAVFAVEDVKVGKIVEETQVYLLPNGRTIATLPPETTLEVLSLGTAEVNGNVWDLIVTPKGVFGYIPRKTWK